MAKYNYNKVKKDFIDKMRPFVEGVKKCYSNDDIKGTIFLGSVVSMVMAIQGTIMTQMI